MTNEDLSQTLNRLQQQLSQNPELDEATVQSLRDLLDQIEVAAARSEAAEPAEKVTAVTSDEEWSQSYKMRKAVEDFESRHPQLTVTLSQIADTLAEMGI